MINRNRFFLSRYTLVSFILIWKLFFLSTVSSYAQNITIKNMTRGLRLEPPLMAIEESHFQQQILWIGTHKGRVYKSDDGGESWLENTVLVDRSTFLGGFYRHQFINFATFGILNEGILPSPGQVFSFQNLIDLNQRFPQAAGQIRGYFNQGIEGDASVDGFLRPHRSGAVSGRLMTEVKKKKGWRLGISWRKQVAIKSARSTNINYITTHPHRSNEILVATGNGLYHSKDSGDSWPLSFSSINSAERVVNFIKFHPQNSQHIWVGTNGGLRISTDGGNTYQIPSNPLVNQSDIKWITFHPKNPEIVFVGVGWALLKSSNGGKTFGISFLNPWPKLSHAARVWIDPTQSHIVLLGTLDGLMMSVDEGKNFERAGGLLFVGQKIVSITTGIYPGHYLVATSDDLWQSFDYGKTWQIAYFGSIQWKITRIVPVHNQPRNYWILTEGEILQATFGEQVIYNQGDYQRLNRLIRSEPSVSQVVQTSLKRAGVHRSMRVNARKRARWRSVLPDIDAAWVKRDVPIEFKLNDFLIADGNMISNLNQSTFDYENISVFAWWDLHKLIFHYDELPWSKGERTSHELERNLQANIINMYQERRSLLRTMVLQSSAGRVRLMRMLRFEELTAYLNYLSGDLFDPFQALKSYQKAF